MRLEGYIRVSRVAGREGDSFISPAVQRQRIEALAAAGGHTIAHFHTDLDEPGSREDRPGFLAALERVEAGRSDGIAVARLDRFARSVVDCANAIKRLQAVDGVLLSAAESIDTSGTFGRFVANLMSALAELELERIRESWEAARAAAVARGVHVASRTPTGYTRAADGRLEEAPGVPIRELFLRKAEGASWRELGAILEGAGVSTPYGSKRWAGRSVSHLIANRVYLGEARSGKFVLAGAHPALISEVEWQAAQVSGAATPGRGGRLLSGLLRCAGCSYRLKPGKMRDRSGERLEIYHCRAHATGACGGRASILGRIIEPWVVDSFFERYPDIRAGAAEASGEILEAEQRVQQAERELLVYQDSLITEVGRELWLQGMRSRAEALEVAQRELGALEATARGAEMPLVAELKAMWPELSVGERRQVLSGAIDAVFLRSANRRNVPVDERALILWRGEAPKNLPGPGRRVGVMPFVWPDGPKALAEAGT